MSKRIDELSTISPGVDPLADWIPVWDTSVGATRKAKASVIATEVLPLIIGDETTTITTGAAKLTFRMPFAATLTDVRASLNTVSSSGIPTVDLNEAGVSVLSTKLTIDVSEKTSVTAAVPRVISDSALADDAEMTVDIDVAGTGAKGLKLWLYLTRA
jgi:hypothetical protein